MYVIVDNEFEEYCYRRYENYLLAASMLGIDNLDDFATFKANNIGWLESKYNLSEDRNIH